MKYKVEIMRIVSYKDTIWIEAKDEYEAEKKGELAVGNMAMDEDNLFDMEDFVNIVDSEDEEDEETPHHELPNEYYR
jgi:hypothetical protein